MKMQVIPFFFNSVYCCSSIFFVLNYYCITRSIIDLLLFSSYVLMQHYIKKLSRYML